MTGVALNSVSDGTPATWELPALAAVQLVHDIAQNTKVDLVVAESFVPRPGVKTWQPDAIEVVGALRYMCYSQDITFELQSATNAKKFSTDAKLKRLEWYIPTTGGHANDALRHLLLAMVKHDQINLSRIGES